MLIANDTSSKDCYFFTRLRVHDYTYRASWIYAFGNNPFLNKLFQLLGSSEKLKEIEIQLQRIVEFYKERLEWLTVSRYRTGLLGDELGFEKLPIFA